MRNKSILVIVVGILLAVTNIASADLFGTGGYQFTIDFVNISGDTNPTSGYGIVNNDYRIGMYEITNDQWNKFVNAYGTVTGNPSSAYDESATHTGTNVPTNEVSWYEGAQFVNWLNTSTGHQAAYKFTGTQGQSDYTFAVWESGDIGYNASNLYRNSDAYYFLPTENEWVKAAYWNGTNLQTYSNASAGDLVSGSPDPAKWNYNSSLRDEPWNVSSGSEELNGTYNMMGNVFELMESPWTSGDYQHVHRGGSYNYSQDYLPSSFRGNSPPYNESYYFGFRVAAVPEPATLLLFGLGGLALRRKR